MKMSIESGVLAGLVAKFGTGKVLMLGYALAGAAMMAVFRPPKSRKEMLMQAAVALGSSFLFGDIIYDLVNGWINLGADWYVPIHALIGAFSWGVFGGFAHLSDRLREDPIEVAKDIKELL